MGKFSCRDQVEANYVAAKRLKQLILNATHSDNVTIEAFGIELKVNALGVFINALQLYSIVKESFDRSLTINIRSLVRSSSELLLLFLCRNSTIIPITTMKPFSFQSLKDRSSPVSKQKYLSEHRNDLSHDISQLGHLVTHDSDCQNHHL